MDIKIIKVPQFMSKKVNVICVNGTPICTARGGKTTSDIIAKLQGYEITVKDGRLNRLIEKILNEQEK